MFKPTFENWEKALMDEPVDVLLDDVEDWSEPDRAKIRLFMKSSEKSEENENRFEGKVLNKIQERIERHKNTTRWDLYKKSFSDKTCNLARVTAYVLGGGFLAYFDSLAGLVGTYKPIHSYVLRAGYVSIVAFTEFFSFYSESLLRKNSIRSLESAMEDGEIFYFDRVDIL